MSKRMTPLLLAVMLAVSPGAAHAREAHIRHPFLAQQPQTAPEEVLLAVEIPAGSGPVEPGTEVEVLCFVQ